MSGSGCGRTPPGSSRRTVPSSESGRRPCYTESLRLLLAQFARGSESKLISTATDDDMEAFMGRVALASRPG